MGTCRANISCRCFVVAENRSIRLVFAKVCNHWKLLKSVKAWQCLSLRHESSLCLTPVHLQRLCNVIVRLANSYGYLSTTVARALLVISRHADRLLVAIVSPCIAHNSVLHILAVHIL